MIRHLLWLLVIVCCTAVIYGWLEQSEKPADKAQSHQLVPDYMAFDLTRTNYNLEGKVVSQVVAKQMSFYDQLEQVQFDQPTFTLFDANLPRWRIQSNEGVWFDDNRVILEDNVRVENLHPNEMFQRIDTQQLEMALDTQILQTKHPVKILGEGFIIDGQGIRADLIGQTMQLYNHQGTVYQHEKN